MKIILLLALLALPTTPFARVPAPCRPFKVVGVVKRRLLKEAPPSRLVAFFELQRGTIFNNIMFDPPSTSYYHTVRPGNKVFVSGRQCDINYFAESVKRVR